ncbi:TrkA family potassium uptake protein [Lachnospiraceae bacterium OttesenSCG-928-D06]|nr:TrkA family potassium uptake protein [Lachnospiraceae bacterium OttesenSCG-928-D06]
MKLRIFLIGGLSKARSLALSLIKKGYRVTAINKDKDACHALAEIEKLQVYIGDGTTPGALGDANIFNADIAIALTDYDYDNLVICELCKKKFQVKKTVALITDPKKTEFFHRMGIDSVVCAITAVANIIEQEAFLDEIATLVPIGEGRVSIAQVPITAKAPVVDKKLSEINLSKDVIIGCVLRGEQSIVPRGDTRILAGDMLLLISSNHQEMEAIKELTGR